MNFKAYCEALGRLYADRGYALELHPGANEDALTLAEAKLGFALDQDMRTAWLHADGGEAWRPVFARPGFLEAYDFLSIEEGLLARDHLRKRSPQYADYEDPEPRDPRVKPGWFEAGWIPFAGLNGESLLLMQDYSPTSLGRRGQIIAFTHDPDSITCVAQDLAALLSASIEAIAADPDEFLIMLDA